MWDDTHPNATSDPMQFPEIVVYINANTTTNTDMLQDSNHASTTG